MTNEDAADCDCYDSHGTNFCAISPIRVAHCVPIFSELTQTFIYDLVVGMAESGPDVDVCVLTWQRKNRESRPFEAVHEVPAPTPAELRRIRAARLLPEGVNWNLIPVTAFERQLQLEIGQWCVDIVHCHFGPTAMVVARACERAGVPVVLTMRGRDASAKLEKWHWRRMYTTMLRRIKGVAFVSRDLQQRMLSYIPEGVVQRVIPSGKSSVPIAFRAPRTPRGKLISVGRLIPKKGHEDAVRCVAHLQSMGFDVELTIVGDGPLREALEEVARRNSVKDRVTFAGSVPYAEVLERMSCSDVLVVASRTAPNGDCEGIPNVIKEGQLLGLPVVATEHGGIPDAVPEKLHGNLVAEGDAAALAGKIGSLLRRSQQELQRDAELARSHVLELFEPGRELLEYRNLYQAVLQR